MTALLEAGSTLLLAVGALFFVAGTVGLSRFPDFYTRLHALTKADNAGLGFVVAGLCLRADDVRTVLLLVFVWMLVLLSGMTACQTVARRAYDIGIEPIGRR